MANSEFARCQLEKHGWKSGSGLGKNESGITEAIKVKIKNDKAGVGVDHGEQFTFQWWNHVFNKAANNIVVESKDDGVEVKCGNSTHITTKKVSKTFADKDMLYGRFIKSSTLRDGLEEQHGNVSSSDSDSSTESCHGNDEDEKLFKACGGMTAHKAARHGLKLNGKLKRIEDQEKWVLQQQKLETVCSKAINKDDKSNSNNKLPTEFKDEIKISANNELDKNSGTNEHVKRKKKSKKRKKSISDVECEKSIKKKKSKRKKH
ncbi:G patch domain-containing protein 4-like [Saccoglossus kowalevskii]|uniref:G patch domain-containing protein 4 n=1 Tax=Saccoglossus kowalevskii TaxID=10224 RepID=A0ABM0GQU7_SACKO|nr:PREDICTED: G patch domain-containing protein 4-like [Saccoglossus kowalevskii]